MSESTPPPVASPTARRDRLVNSLRALLSNDNIDLELFKSGATWPGAEDLINRRDESQLSPMSMPADPPPSPALLPPLVTTNSYASIAQSDSTPTSSYRKTSPQVPISESTFMLDPALFLDQPYMGESGDFPMEKLASWPRELGDSMAVDDSITHFIPEMDPYCQFWTSMSSSPYDFFPDVTPDQMNMDVDMIFDQVPSLPAEASTAVSDCVMKGALAPVRAGPGDHDHSHESPHLSPQLTSREPNTVELTTTTTTPNQQQQRQQHQHQQHQQYQQHQQHQHQGHQKHQHQQNQHPSPSDSGPSNLPSAPGSPASTKSPPQKPKSQRAHYVVERKYRTGLQIKFEALRDCITAYKRQQIHNQHQQQLSFRSSSSPREDVPEPAINAKLNKADVLTSAVTCLEELQEENEVLIEHFKQLLQRFRAAKVTFGELVGDHAWAPN